jgi:hypothetical protein
MKNRTIILAAVVLMGLYLPWLAEGTTMSSGNYSVYAGQVSDDQLFSGGMSSGNLSLYPAGNIVYDQDAENPTNSPVVNNNVNRNTNMVNNNVNSNTNSNANRNTVLPTNSAVLNINQPTTPIEQVNNNINTNAAAAGKDASLIEWWWVAGLGLLVLLVVLGVLIGRRRKRQGPVNKPPEQLG